MTGEVQQTSARNKSWWWLVVLIVTLGLVGTGFAVFAVSNATAHHRYDELISGGEGLVLTIPRFGHDYAVPIVEGTSQTSLREGVGWYDNTAEPGTIGNFVLAGHRFGWGQPFADLADLGVGDEIIVSTGTVSYTYTIITGPTQVAHDQVDVLAPVPGDGDRAPTKALITLTTAGSLLPSPNRMIVIGELSYV